MSKRYLIIVNSSKKESLVFSEKLINHIVSSSSQAIKYDEDVNLSDGFDFALVLGGDGTVIDAASILYEYNIPIACINFGTLGYLSCCEPDEAFDLIDRLNKDDYFLENRTVLEGVIIRDNVQTDSFMSINDISIHRGIVNSSLNFELTINDEVIDTFCSDGMLVSTPTGSTAYNLSAGGPVVAPNSNCFVVTQICAHSLNDCPIVISDNDTVKIEILNDVSSPVFVSDHSKPIELKIGDTVFIHKGKNTIKTVKIIDSSFYSVLRKKISRR